mmetsp:Transcript_19688/g.59404  ORF Transcript_19688/g.59404 Transcript_19688/m.59404 type:complete len:281 (-) Transcript_19688:155-997(-)
MCRMCPCHSTAPSALLTRHLRPRQCRLPHLCQHWHGDSTRAPLSCPFPPVRRWWPAWRRSPARSCCTSVAARAACSRSGRCWFRRARPAGSRPAPLSIKMRWRPQCGCRPASGRGSSCTAATSSQHRRSGTRPQPSLSAPWALMTVPLPAWPTVCKGSGRALEWWHYCGLFAPIRTEPRQASISPGRLLTAQEEQGTAACMYTESVGRPRPHAVLALSLWLRLGAPAWAAAAPYCTLPLRTCAVSLRLVLVSVGCFCDACSVVVVPACELLALPATSRRS